MKRGLLITAVVLALGASEAVAAPFTPRLNLAYKLALDYWEREPAACESGINGVIVPEDTTTPGDPGAQFAGLALLPCEFWVAHYLADPQLLDDACMVMIHEIGHLLGYGHSRNPRSPMHTNSRKRHRTKPCVVAGKRSILLLDLHGFLREFQSRGEWHRARNTSRTIHRIAGRFWAPLR